MGGALLAGWLDRGVARQDVHVVEPNGDSAAALADRLGVNVVGGIEALADGLKPALVMFAVKPQVMAAVAPPYQRYAGPATVFLSIAAGLPIAFFEKHLGHDAAIVRAMPNTPAAVGRGATVAVANARVADEQQRLCHDLLAAVGEVHWVTDEDLIHAVTGLSGSGPAYVFHFVECLTEAGVDAGLSRDLATALARATVTGAGELLHRSPDTPEVLRRNVTSPGGTTAAGLEILMAAEGGLPDLVSRVVAAATRRSRELAGG